MTAHHPHHAEIPSAVDGPSFLVGIGVYGFSLVTSNFSHLLGEVSGSTVQLTSALIAAIVPISASYFNYLKSRDLQQITSLTNETAKLRGEHDAAIGQAKSLQSQLAEACAKIKELESAMNGKMHGAAEGGI